MLSIPIISEFDSKGIRRATREFKQLETSGQRVGWSLSKAGKMAAIGFAAIGASAVAAGRAAWDFAKAAMEDQRSQLQLAKALKATTKATDAQVKATEKWITKTSMALGVADDELRPALARLVRSTHDVQKAQSILNTALNVSAGTGRPLAQIVQALGRAYDGNTTALGRLGLGFSKAELKGKTFAQIQERINQQFSGAAAAQAQTFEGRIAKLKVRFGEIKESLGVIVIEYATKFLDFGDKIAKAYGEGGAAGAMRKFNEQVTNLMNKDVDKGRSAGGNLLAGLAKTYNFLLRTGAAVGAGAAAGLGVALTPVFPQAAKLAQIGGRNVGRAITSPDLPYTAKTGVTVINNFNGAVLDPISAGREIKRILSQVDRRTGGR